MSTICAHTYSNHASQYFHKNVTALIKQTQLGGRSSSSHKNKTILFQPRYIIGLIQACAACWGCWVFCLVTERRRRDSTAPHLGQRERHTNRLALWLSWHGCTSQHSDCQPCNLINDSPAWPRRPRTNRRSKLFLLKGTNELQTGAGHRLQTPGKRFPFCWIGSAKSSDLLGDVDRYRTFAFCHRTTLLYQCMWLWQIATSTTAVKWKEKRWVSKYCTNKSVAISD